MNITKFKTVSCITFAVIAFLSCNNKNHIDKYNVNLDSLKTLPDNYYAYRRSSGIFLDNNDYRIWFSLDRKGNISKVNKVQDLQNLHNETDSAIAAYAIDTTYNKKLAQQFIELSRRYKFGHIKIDRNNIIFFSYRDGLSQQYVRAMNDSVHQLYMNKKNFRLLDNGWFENQEE